MKKENITNDFLFNKLMNDDATVDSFSDILDLSSGYLNREIFIGDIDENTGSAADSLIRYWNRVDEENDTPIEKRQPIKIYVDSYGGVLTSALTVIDAIKLSKTPVWTINAGCAYSGGCLIAICGHHRFTYPHSTYMLHEGSTGQIADAGKFRNYSEFYIRLLDVLKDIVIDNTNIDEDYYKTIQKDDYWLMAKEAIERGFADDIIEEFV